MTLRFLPTPPTIRRLCITWATMTDFSNDDADLSQTPAAQELESALQGRNVAYRLEGEPGQLRMIVLMPRAGE